MARKKNNQAKRVERRVRLAREDRGSVALTVGWMLTALATALALAIVAIAQLLIWQFPPDSAGAQPLRLVPALFLAIGVITGLVCLVLTPVVYRVRRDPPPRSIAIGAVVVSLLPMVIIGWQMLNA